MKKLFYLLPLLIGCINPELMTYQCDELYSDFNCDIPNNYTFFDNSGNNVSPYYWGYQRFNPYYGNQYNYYYINPETKPQNVTISKRPSIWSGQSIENSRNKDQYGNTLGPNEYKTRDINGQRGVGSTTRPNSPSVEKKPRNSSNSRNN